MSNTNSQQPTGDRPGLGRRDFIKAGALGLAGLSLGSPAHAKALLKTHGRQANSVILLWTQGGMSQVDTWDPKPDMDPKNLCPFPFDTAIDTNVPGIRISASLPKLAKVADKYSIIRTMTTSPAQGHGGCSYVMQSGHPMKTKQSGLSYPHVGSVVALDRLGSGEYTGVLPPFVWLTKTMGIYEVRGFVEPKYQAFMTGGDPTAEKFEVAGLVFPKGMTEERFKRRRSLLQNLDSLSKRQEKDDRFERMNSFQDGAYDLLTGDAKETFNLSLEKDELRDQYGRNHIGQCCLAARRLVEKGVPFVNVFFYNTRTLVDGKKITATPARTDWDTHSDNFAQMSRLCPILDSALSTLLTDLSDRGLLETTIVVCVGEMGGSPKLSGKPGLLGRNHYPRCFSGVIAGGGFKGGNVVGVTNEDGGQIVERPVHPWDLWASVYTKMGIDYTERIPTPSGCGQAFISPLATGNVPGTGGLLTEIM